MNTTAKAAWKVSARGNSIPRNMLIFRIFLLSERPPAPAISVTFHCPVLSFFSGQISQKNTAAELTDERWSWRERASMIESERRRRFDELYASYDRRVLAYCLYVTSDRDLAHDVFQEVFVKVYQALHTLRDSDKEANWLFRIARNECLNALKSRQRSDRRNISSRSRARARRRRSTTIMTSRCTCASSPGDRTASARLPRSPAAG
jgi:hypothetical protein